MTESWKSAEEDIKSNQVHATQVSKEQPLMGGTRKGHARVSETDQKIAMNTGGMSHSKHKTPTGAPKAPGKKEETNQVRCKAIEVEPPQLPKGPYGTNARGDAPPQSKTRTKDGNRPERHGARGATMRWEQTMRPTQRNGRGYAQDRARERQQSPPQKRTRPPPRRSEGRNV